MKRLTIAILLVVVLLLGAVLIAPGFIDWGKYREQIEAQVAAATGHDLSIGGKISLALLPSPRLYVEDVTLTPAGGTEAIVGLERANVNVSVRKLLQGDLIVESVGLTKPRIYIEVDANGRPNWMSPEIEAAMAGRKSAPASGGGDEGKFLKSVSLESVRIEDGSFIFVNVSDESRYEISGVDLLLKADDLLGPYKVEGDLSYGGNAVEFKGAIGRIDNQESIPVQLDAALPAREMTFAYRGIVALGDTPEVQGDLAIEARKLAAAGADLPLSTSALQKGASLKGMVTASPHQLHLKTARIVLGDAVLSGAVAVKGLDKPPYNIELTLAADRPVDLDVWLPQDQGAAAGTKKAEVKPEGFLPQSVTLPVPFDATIKLSAPEITYKGKSFKNVDVRIGKAAGAFEGKLTASEGPGNASIDASGKLSFASRSEVEGGGAVLSDPSLNINARVVSGNIANLVTPFLPAEMAQMAALRLYDAMDASVKATVDPAKISIGDSVVKLDQTTFGLSGAFVPAQGATKRDRLTLQLVADTLDVNKITNRLKQNTGAPPATAAPAGKTDVAAMVKSLTLPLDLAFDLGAQKILYKDMPVGAVRLEGTLAGDTLDLKTASIGDFFGGQFRASGLIQDTQKLQGIDLRLSGQARELEAILAALKIDAQALPRPFGALAFQADIIGNDQALGFKASVSALKGKVDASGQLTDVLVAPKINSLVTSLNHPNFVEAMRIVDPKFKGGPGLEKPIDFYAKIERADKMYTLSEMKANIGPMPVVGDIRMNTAAIRPVIAGNLRFGTVPLGDILGSRPTSTMPAADGGTDVRWSRNAINTDWMHAVDLDLKLEAKAINYDRWAFVSPRASVKLAEGLLTIPDLESGLFGGGIKGSAQVKSTKDPREPVSVATSLALTQVAVESFAHALTGAQVISSQGAADLTADLKASGISPAAMIVDLSGQGTLSAGEFILKGVDLPRFARALSEETKPGDTATGLWKGATRGGQTEFNSMNGKFTVRQGVVNINPLILDGPQVAINSVGDVNLPRWTILLTNQISFKPQGDLPPDVPSFEVTIQGPLDNPANTFGKGLLEDYLQRKIARKAQEIIGEKVGQELGGEFGETLGKALGLPGLGGVVQPKAAPQPQPQPQQQQSPQQQAPANENQQPQPQQQPPAQQQQQDVPPEIQLFQGILNELSR